MICTKISDLIGFVCHPLTEDGSIAMIDTPFSFPDGDDVPVFVEKFGKQVRFFDDGGVIFHLLGRGLSFDDHRKTRFIKSLAEPNGIVLNEIGELEIWSAELDAPAAFAKYMATMLALVRWEGEQNGVATDLTLLIDEVEMYLRAWKSTAPLVTHPEYIGVSGQVYTLDFNFDGSAVIAIGTHAATVSAAAKKLLDIRAESSNEGLKILVVIDDRADAEAARREGLILDSVGSVLMMSRLEKNANIRSVRN